MKAVLEGIVKDFERAGMPEYHPERVDGVLKESITLRKNGDIWNVTTVTNSKGTRYYVSYQGSSMASGKSLTVCRMLNCHRVPLELGAKLLTVISRAEGRPSVFDTDANGGTGFKDVEVSRSAILRLPGVIEDFYK